MRAIVKYDHGYGNMELRDVPEPTCGDHDVKIKVMAVGICGSDLHIYKGDITIPTKVPCIIGHEFSGIISEVGKQVSRFKVGQRVTGENTRIACGYCRHCASGSYNLCRARRATGYAYDGAYAEFVVVPEKRVHLLPENVDFITGALSDPSACVHHAVHDLTGVNAGDKVLITGTGAMGLFSVQYVKANGGITIITGLDKDQKRLKMARNLGADITVNVEKQDLEKIIMDETNGEGVDISLECSGSQKGAEDALRLLRREGKYTQIGIFGKPISFNLDLVLSGEIKLTGSFSQKYLSWKEALKLYSQEKIDARSIVTDILPLESWEEGFNRCFDGSAVKVVFLPWGAFDDIEFTS